MHDKFINRRELKKRIIVVALPKGRGYQVKHDIPGEQIVCEVPSLELGATIVKALRERQELLIAKRLLAEHMQKKGREV